MADEVKNPNPATPRRRPLVISVTRMLVAAPFAVAGLRGGQAFAVTDPPSPTTSAPPHTTTAPPAPSPTPTPTPAPAPAPAPSPAPTPSPSGGPSPSISTPEPASLALLGSGIAIAGSGVLARRVRERIRSLLERWAEDDEA